MSNIFSTFKNEIAKSKETIQLGHLNGIGVPVAITTALRDLKKNII